MAKATVKPTAVLAFSGGLDTSFCGVWLREQGYRLVTVTVDTGGFAPVELRTIERRAREVGSERHYTVDRRQLVYDRFVAYLIKGNVLRGGVYPVSVACERTAQAMAAAEIARKEKAKAVAHGSTGAGNDQVRFDIALSVLVPDLMNLTPIRQLGWSREKEADYLERRGIRVERKTTRYSINAGLWGTTIGGGETRNAWETPPDEVYRQTVPPEKAPDRAEEIVIGFRKGLPVSLGGRALSPLKLVEKLQAAGGRHGFGRGIHLGQTVLGIKGRIAFEAPAALLLVMAHRELEKLVLTQQQQTWKEFAATAYGQLMHEGHYFDPVMRDLEALIDSSQAAVTGDIRARLYKGSAQVLGCRSPHSLLDRRIATYGEQTLSWTSEEARGFCKLFGMPETLARKARKSGR